jgi:hypothetical protein
MHDPDVGVNGSTSRSVSGNCVDFRIQSITALIGEISHGFPWMMILVRWKSADNFMIRSH